jgi:hypothetical protein
VIEVNAGSHPELFWALRGGGNFGIVTRFTFRAHDFGPMMRISRLTETGEPCILPLPTEAGRGIPTSWRGLPG